MLTRFTTSVNIIRDDNAELHYIPTPNAIRVANQICSDFKKGQHSFNLVGSYGTGKSSFLWAFEQVLAKKKRHFALDIVSKPNVQFIKLVGEYKSIINAVAEHLGINDSINNIDDILAELFNQYHELGKNGLLVILLDEFGKYLEYAANNEPEKELYFIQQLAEFANNPKLNILLVTTVHQNYDAYATNLNQTQKLEWDKIKGRFREISFNEPIEQLLFLASQHINKKVEAKKYKKEIVEISDLLVKAKLFSTNENYVKDIAENLFPLDPISSNVLTIALQRYGQNERSLFSFLESTDHTGLYQHSTLNAGFYTLNEVYEYVIFNFYSFINSIHNPDFNGWKYIKISLEKTEASFDKSVNDYAKVVKVIGLLNITSQAGARIDKQLLVTYCQTCLGIKKAAAIIDDLENKKIIFYREFNNRYILFEGTDLDIPSALRDVSKKVSNTVDIVGSLNKHFQFPLVFAKRIMFEKGTPRLFEYKVSNEPINTEPKDEIDGYINLVFNEKDILEDIIKLSANQQQAILYCFYTKTQAIRDLLFEIEKTKKVIQENQEDKVAKRELNNILIGQQNLLEHKILNSFYGSRSEVKWIFKGRMLTINNKKDFNTTLSIICDTVYHQTPVFKNELVNKHKISVSIHGAKKSFFKALVNNWDKPDLGFPVNNFPPEKTIYLSLLKQNGIEFYSDTHNINNAINENSSFFHLWKWSNDFIESCKKSNRTIQEFIEPLTKQPFKLKQGFIDFWVASYLILRKEDFALFGKDSYIPTITDEILELVIKYPDDYYIKAFDLDGVRLDIFNSYRNFLNLNVDNKLSNDAFIETIKPFLTFYRKLPDYAKHTKRLSKEALAIRAAIAQSKDPEKTFFEDFPNALGYSLDSLQKKKDELHEYIEKMQQAIRDIRSGYDNLMERFEEFIVEEIIGKKKMVYPDYKLTLQKRFKSLKKHLCLPNQKSFLQRLDSAIEDKNPWLNSIAQAVTNKTLDNFKDEDEFLLKDKFKGMIVDLDSLTEISKADVDEVTEDVVGIELSSFANGVNKKIIRLPKNKQKEINKIEETLKAQLSKDKTLNIAAVANILKDLMH